MLIPHWCFYYFGLIYDLVFVALVRGAHLPRLHVRGRPAGSNRARPDDPRQEHVAPADRRRHQHLNKDSNHHRSIPNFKKINYKSVNVSLSLKLTRTK